MAVRGSDITIDLLFRGRGANRRKISECYCSYSIWKQGCGGIKELKLKPCTVQAQPMETSYFSLSKKVSIGESLFNQLSSASVRGTIGYAAPEYGMGGQPSIYGHVYLFFFFGKMLI
ncbi:PREDICTED: uncharacterized protein LOC106318664 isoform X2 [Brassica oleracea var. oleracea]|uniref:uncharacterized protein LOC106318664 isoform X2 n=1 Tax=Brassica oleracea var. oleracea TaxID=109376 RepID=UPI0006A6BBB8|nr:PREDICTED: uncharacterized protein LOC106318664 isoform X2 [Brassica oleracea var. oleracea]